MILEFSPKQLLEHLLERKSMSLHERTQSLTSKLYCNLCLRHLNFKQYMATIVVLQMYEADLFIRCNKNVYAAAKPHLKLCKQLQGVTRLLQSVTHPSLSMAKENPPGTASDRKLEARDGIRFNYHY